MARKRSKLRELLDLEGLNLNQLLEECTFDGVCLGICMNEGCEFTRMVEPDQNEGWCEMCGTPTVVSGAILGGVI